MAEEDRNFKFIYQGKLISIKPELLGEFMRELKRQKTGKPVEDKGLDKKGKKK
jgi:hypothetical protein